jgi:hypothetical protein
MEKYHMNKYYIIEIIQPKYRSCELKFDLTTDLVCDIVDGEHIVKKFFCHMEAEDYIIQEKNAKHMFAIKEVYGN